MNRPPTHTELANALRIFSTDIQEGEYDFIMLANYLMTIVKHGTGCGQRDAIFEQLSAKHQQLLRVIAMRAGHHDQ